ncbi:MAG: isopeptide-forming domain-containing fimbrial protein [Eubacteriales bacterium]|nr:isopeptide-forming domain-containing fimbrial protein [Eubacteriales bacterium]
MSKMKKLLSVILAFTMVLAMSITAFAEGEKAPATKYSYEAYQIFSGTVDEKGELTGIDWGTGVNSPALVAALKADTTFEGAFANASSATDVAAILAGYGNDSPKMKAFAEVVAANLTTIKTTGDDKVTLPAAGYYLIKDADGTVPDGESYTRYIIKTSSAAEITPQRKADVPEMIKKVKENTTTTVGKATLRDYETPDDYNDVADYNIGDKVPFQIVGSLPSNYADYKTYYYQFSDSYNKSQLALDANSIKVTVNGTTPVTGFTLAETDGGFTLTCTDLKTAIPTLTADDVIVVDYEMTLLSGANVGAGNGNENEAKLIFSNNPNKGHDGEKGETPEDKVVVFTYTAPVEKIDGTTLAKLENVEFVFQNADNKYVTVDENGKVTGWVDTKEAATVLKTKADGTFAIVGLDDGTYKLIETKPLPGYNAIDPITVVVDADTTNTQDWNGAQSSVSTKVDLKVNGTPVTGEKIVVENKSGATLPTTGGMGTTMFYLIGALCVVCAGVLLISKKRVAR